MPLKGSAQEEHGSYREVQELRREIKLALEHGQSWVMNGEMMAEFTKHNGRLESGSDEGSPAVGQITRGRVTAAVRETPSAAVGMARDIPTEQETHLREGASRNLEVTGPGGTALPAKVGAPRGQPDKPGKAGEWGAYPGGELGGGFDFSVSRHLAVDHTAAPSFSGLNREFNPRARHDRYHVR